MSPLWSHICNYLSWIIWIRSDTGSLLISMHVNGRNGVHVGDSLVTDLPHCGNDIGKVDILRAVTTRCLRSCCDIRKDKYGSVDWMCCFWSDWHSVLWWNILVNDIVDICGIHSANWSSPVCMSPNRWESSYLDVVEVFGEYGRRQWIIWCCGSTTEWRRGWYSYSFIVSFIVFVARSGTTGYEGSHRHQKHQESWCKSVNQHEFGADKVRYCFDNCHLGLCRIIETVVSEEIRVIDEVRCLVWVFILVWRRMRR